MPKKPTLIGLTGGVATGKSTVARMFAAAGVSVIDTDKIAHAVILKGTRAHKKILKLCGNLVIKGDGEIDRGRLALMIFGASQAQRSLRKKIERIVHPEVWKGVQRSMFNVQGQIIIEVPLLFETGWDKKMDVNIAVVCSQKEQRRRCRPEFLNRMKSQMSLHQKAADADFVINNSGSRGETKRQVLWFVNHSLRCSIVKP